MYECHQYLLRQNCQIIFLKLISVKAEVADTARLKRKLVHSVQNTDTYSPIRALFPKMKGEHTEW